MFAAVQTQPFHATHHTEVLVPKTEHPFWSVDFDKRLVVAAATLRTNRWRFHYGRNAGGRLGELEIDEQQIATIASGLSNTNRIQTTISLPTVQSVIAKLQRIFGQNPRIGDIFLIECSDDAAVSDLLDDGFVPVATATEKETNGIGGFLAAVPKGVNPKKAMSISVAKDGKPGVSRVQKTPFLTTSHVLALSPLISGLSESELCVLAAFIESQSWRFSYGRSASIERLKEVRLSL